MAGSSASSSPPCRVPVSPRIRIIAPTERRADKIVKSLVSVSMGADEVEAAELTMAVVYVILATLLNFATFGFTTGVLSGATPMLEETWRLGEWALALNVSCGVGSAAVGAGLGGHLGDALGRLYAIRVASVLATVATVCSAVAPTFALFIAARCALGLAIGISFTVVPLYISETVPPDFRGRIVDLCDFAVVAGQLVAGLVNGVCSTCLRGIVRAPWRVSLGAGVVLPAALVWCAAVKNHESPRWLARQDRRADALGAITALHGGAVDEHEEIVDALTHREDDALVQGLWRTQRVRRALRLGAGMQVLNQLSGINTAMYYGGTILIAAGFHQKLAIWLSSALTAAQLLGVAISVATIDSRGRRFTALRSVALTIPFLVALTVAFTLGWSLLAVAGLLGYLVAFGSGLSGVAYVINSEIYPLAIRARCSAIGGMAFWITNFVVSLGFPIVTEHVGAQYAFAFFGVSSCTGLLVLFFVLPETAHKTLDEIAEFFRAEPYPMSKWHCESRAAIRKNLLCQCTELDDDDDDDDDNDEEQQLSSPTSASAEPHYRALEARCESGLGAEDEQWRE